MAVPPALHAIDLEMRTPIGDLDDGCPFAAAQFLNQLDAGRPLLLPAGGAAGSARGQARGQTPLARIRIPKQAIDQADTASRCESIAFNPWHALPAHRPLGNMNRARREIYQAMAAFRGRRAGAATR